MKFLKYLCLGLLFCGCNSKENISLPTDAILIDVRTQAEYQSGFIAGAINIPHDQIADKIAEVAPDKTTPIYLYCRSGRRVEIAISTLKKLGYTNLVNLGGYADAKRKLDK